MKSKSYKPCVDCGADCELIHNKEVCWGQVDAEDEVGVGNRDEDGVYEDYRWVHFCEGHEVLKYREEKE